jgi:hypothetical protein
MLVKIKWSRLEWHFGMRVGGLVGEGGGVGGVGLDLVVLIGVFNHSSTNI